MLADFLKHEDLVFANIEFHKNDLQLTNDNLNNLKTDFNYLVKLYCSGVLSQDFRMDSFCNEHEFNTKVKEDRNSPFIHNCGTSRCLIGWSITNPDLKIDRSKYNIETQFVSKVTYDFAYVDYSIDRYNLNKLLWEFLFSSEWDNKVYYHMIEDIDQSIYPKDPLINELMSIVNLMKMRYVIDIISSPDFRTSSKYDELVKFALVFRETEYFSKVTYDETNNWVNTDIFYETIKSFIKYLHDDKQLYKLINDNVKYKII